MKIKSLYERLDLSLVAICTSYFLLDRTVWNDFCQAVAEASIVRLCPWDLSASVVHHGWFLIYGDAIGVLTMVHS